MSVVAGTKKKLSCTICDKRYRVLIADGEWPGIWLCNECFERLDQFDRDHTYPAFLFAAEIIRNRDAARSEGVG